MSARLILTAIAFAGFAPLTDAQQLDRRNRDEPEVVVEAGGRFGTCDVLRFSRDGAFLFAGGDDKVVRAWPHAAAGLDLDQAKTLRWRAWREQRGGVKAIDIRADGKRVAIGGYGMKPATVAIVDRETGDTIAQTWPNGRNGIDNYFSVMAIAFHPDGRRLAFGTADGSLWLWDPAKLLEPKRDGHTWNSPARVGKFAPAKRGETAEEFNYPRLLFFPDADSLGAVSLDGKVGFWSLAGPLSDDPAKPIPAAVRTFDINDQNQPGEATHWVYRAELTADRQSVVLGCLDPLVLIRSLDGKNAARLALPEGHFPRAIAVNPANGELAIGVGGARDIKPQFYLEGNDTIWLTKAPPATGAFEPVSKLSHTGPAEALAFHPSENRLAIAGGDADEVTLLDLAKPKEPLTVVRGAGRRPWAVNLSTNGNMLGIQTGRNPEANHPNARGTGNWTAFNVPRMGKGNPEGQKWVDPLASADGWTVIPDKHSRFVWRAVHKDGPADGFALALDRGRDQAPTCFTFIPAKNGKPTRLLVGHDYGCSLFELQPDGVTRTKLFTGHSGPVLSLVAAADQTWFVSGGADHTVASYSLEDWPSNAGLGAKIEVANGKPTVLAVDVGSPAWEAGLSAGEVIDLLVVDGGTIIFDHRPGQSPLGTARDVVAAVKSPIPGKELYFGLEAAGKPRRETLTTVRQRPLWKWFPGFDDAGRMTDWVIWMWKGSYYHTESANGDRIIGWHVNAPEADGRPVFYQFNQFEDHYHKYAVLQKLVTSRSVADALQLLAEEDPRPGTFSKFEPAPPRVFLDSLVVGQGPVTATIEVKPRGSNPDLLPEHVELWLNDYRIATWPQPGGAPLDPRMVFTAALPIPASAFREGENKFTVLTFNARGGRGEGTEQVRNPNTAGSPSLHGLVVGVNDYANSQVAAAAIAPRKGFQDLRNAVKDATDLQASFKAYLGKGRHYPEGKIETLLNREAERQQVLEDLAAMKGRVKPDDLLVVFFAGHGDLPGAKRGPAGPGGSRGAVIEPGPFVFCCPDYSDNNVAQTSVSAEDLFKTLAGINCRKLVLLDACHAGGAADANLLRRLIPNGQGPFVIAACDQSELSYEDPQLGHGLFTYAILDALGDKYRTADRNTDGVLSAEELYRYVSNRVPELMDALNPGNTQTPICFPRQPPKFAIVKR